MTSERTRSVIVKYLLLGLLLLSLVFLIFSQIRRSRPVAVVVSDTFQLRAKPSRDSEAVGQTAIGEVYPILRRVRGGDTSYGNRWYLVRRPDDSTAYLVAAGGRTQQTINTDELRRIEAYRMALPPIQFNSRDDFTETLSLFPESYREKLTVLHVLYPQWIFEPLPVTDTWETVLEAQTEPEHKNLVQYEESAFFEGYRWMVKNSTVYDGSNWYPATEEAIAWHLDPRNFLNPRDIFQFMSLRASSSGSSELGVRGIFAGNSALEALVPEVMAAAEAADILPEALAGRMKLEISSGDSISLLARGLYDPDTPPLISGSASPSLLSPAEQLSQLETVRAQRTLTETETKILSELKAGRSGYLAPTDRYYNVYNIGAYPDPTQIAGAQMNGARFAAGRLTTDPDLRERLHLPWTSQESAVLGGAKFIALEYIDRGQDTPYLQKFDLLSGTYNHQYMQALFAALHEGRNYHKVWLESGRIDDAIHFRIPVYRDLPEETKEGNR